MILPRSSMSFIIVKVGMLFARVATMPAAAMSPIPSFLPKTSRGALKTLVMKVTMGNAPARTMAMLPMTA